MRETPDEFWRDVSVVLKHIRFIPASNIDIDAIIPLFEGQDTVLTLDTFEDLAESDQIVEAAAQELGIDPTELRENLTVRAEERNPRDPEGVDRLPLEATGTSRDQAKESAAAAMDAFVEAAERFHSGR